MISSIGGMTMIVKRFAGALRRQDWMAVAVEFLLVVLGILIAFQINDWSANRQARVERTAATERLLEEAESDVAYIRQAVGYQQGNVDALRQLALAISSTGRQRAGEPGLAKQIVRARVMVPLAPPSSVYDDIASSGELSQVGDIGVRSSISRYRSTLSFEERGRQQFQTILNDFQRIAAFRFRVDEQGLLSADVDIPSLAADADARQLVALTAENHRVVLMLRKRALRDAERMCVALARAVGRSCKLNQPPPSFD